jgi:hypothetical protein
MEYDIPGNINHTRFVESPGCEQADIPLIFLFQTKIPIPASGSINQAGC